jgi:two-component system sensor histidine kinase CreC
MRVYITDREGILLFDSRHIDPPGTDYSKWRDVALTLAGQYGARATQVDAKVSDSSVLYVAAPIQVKGEIAGVLTVAKPSSAINAFIRDARPRIFKVGLLSLAAAVFLSLLVSAWIARPIKRLIRYADDIRQGRRVMLPALGRTEVGELGAAFERMREALEGKKYAEQYVQKLTHEIKSPLSAIRGAAELLKEDMPAAQRQRFLTNIRQETGRIQNLIDRMLALSAIEGMKNLQRIESLSAAALIRKVVEEKKVVLDQKKITVHIRGEDAVKVRGDHFLLHQALSNLLQNAVDFSLQGSEIDIETDHNGKYLYFSVSDSGPGVPDYAREKVFDKFFSLQRPDGGRKSTGLGLNFVREVALLHAGDIRLENRATAGTRAVLSLPVG